MRSATSCLGTLFLLCLLAGCATTASTTRPPDGVTNAAARPAAPQATTPRPTVRLEIDPASNTAFRPRVEKRLHTDELAADLVLEGTTARPVDYTLRLKFDFRELPLTDAEGIWAMTDMLLLTMYPASCNRYRFSLDATLADASGNRFKTYSLQDLDTAWVWLLIGPKCASPEGMNGEGVGDAAEDLLVALYRKMQRDDVLNPTRLSELKTSQGPLVYVRATSAEDLVKEGFLLDELPVRFTFDPAEATVADYTLQLDLSVTGRDYSAGRAALALMTVGITGVCPTRTATREGSVVDRQGRLTSHYRSDAHWQPSMSDNCAGGAVSDRPEMVRKLAQVLSSKVTSASLAAVDPARATAKVRVVTNAARAVVERVASEQALFAYVTFETAEQVSADYTLDLAFSASGGGSRIGPEASTAQQVAVGFMFGLTFGNVAFLCKRTEHLLQVQLKDAAGAVIASGKAAKSAIPETAGCGPDQEPSADIAEFLVREALRKLATDPRLPESFRATHDVRAR
jgi:hypothetical protein